ncbi:MULTISPECIES: L-aspartate oxidase [Haloarcula]|mgnify:FL=1|jgi:succinate dehydrogenase / fumarate reductase flavoprotein subunit|uniref:FAD-dependent oxidoreductase n=2 Tax=Haloarcula marismortui TaxID=2238 RepID=Q5V5I9_HALMA|nr:MULTISPECIES: FAD-dependent oxidoreductase [Haloarcula]AAV45213.1 succinate dehydrogenase flavoprotein subunit [Haloarcula marismortui ATCC 43049]EMA21895.1 succinate dehydrogenase flavoprotein subunit [Haloarcula californiae ATCC 33799]NHN62217.1 FAD-dependent oxidoreductase [Haloarcula sp. JP-Z28]QCP92994.1 FAD-dependent oxidoreductase [Haloarcula marismortui ATCC 43049]
MTPQKPSADGEQAADGRASDAGPAVDYETVSVPVLVVGAGAAGARVAIGLAENGVEPLVIGKRDHGDAHTTWAAGGINASLGSLDPEDDWTIHAADTLDEGHFINDPKAVELTAKHMPDRIRELDDWGMPFDRTEDGKINQRYFGAQSFRRTCFVGDRTGEAMLDTLVDKAQSLGIPYRDNVMITRLLSDGDQVYGAAGYDMESGEFILFESDHIVLAAGGSSALYNRHSSRDEENNGDGPALALEAGASLMDMEFVQFHPTGMVGDRYGEDWDGRLVTEAVRGEGGRLLNADGERFMEEYSPDQMELDARDVVARAIAQELREGRGTENGGVYLDISHREDEYIKSRLPRMYERFMDLGVDITEKPMEVAPTAHYSMGGVDIDFESGETGVGGLYAVGETVAGVHGANRLGGNSLAETVAIGALVGDHVATQVTGDDRNGALPDGQRAIAEREFQSLRELEASDGDETPEQLLADLGDLLWEHAGILRTDESVSAGLEKLRNLRERTGNMHVDGDRTSLSFELAVDLSFSLTVAEALLLGARKRDESRGAHYRTDAPDVDPDWRRNILVDQGDTGLELTTRGVAEPSDAVSEAVDVGYELDYHHLE